MSRLLLLVGETNSDHDALVMNIPAISHGYVTVCVQTGTRFHLLI